MAEPRSILVAAGVALIGAGGGVAVGGVAGAAIGAAAGLAFGVFAAASDMRSIVALAVALGGAVGFVLGRSIVHVLCSPSGCPAVEWTAAAATGIGSVVGVGLVVALATRSFDEYREAVAARRPPPTPGCETDESPEES